MAATIGNFASGDVLTAAQMNTLGLEFLDDQTFSGYGGVVSNSLNKSDFATYFVSFYGKLNTGASATYLRFMHNGSEVSGANYNYSASYANFTGGTPGVVSSTSSTNIRIGGVNTSGTMTSMWISLGYDNRAGVTWQGFYGNLSSWAGSGWFRDGGVTSPDGLKIYRTANQADFRMRVYGLRS